MKGIFFRTSLDTAIVFGWEIMYTKCVTPFCSSHTLPLVSCLDWPQSTRGTPAYFGHFRAPLGTSGHITTSKLYTAYRVLPRMCQEEQWTCCRTNNFPNLYDMTNVPLLLAYQGQFDAITRLCCQVVRFLACFSNAT